MAEGIPAFGPVVRPVGLPDDGMTGVSGRARAVAIGNNGLESIGPRLTRNPGADYIISKTSMASTRKKKANEDTTRSDI